MSGATNRESDKIMLRVPDGLRDRIRAAAEANRRSMNAEIVATLEDKYPVPETRLDLLARYLLDVLPGVTPPQARHMALALAPDIESAAREQLAAPRPPDP